MKTQKLQDEYIPSILRDSVTDNFIFVKIKFPLPGLATSSAELVPASSFESPHAKIYFCFCSTRKSPCGDFSCGQGETRTPNP